MSGLGDICGYDYSLDQSRVKYMKQLASQYIDHKVVDKATDGWTGLRPCSPDDNPIFR